MRALCHAITLFLFVVMVLPELFLRERFDCVTRGITHCDNPTVEAVFRLSDALGFSILLVLPGLIYLVAVIVSLASLASWLSRLMGQWLRRLQRRE
jgi:hypothetical protein